MGNSFWFALEVVVIFSVIIYQLYHSRNVYLNIQQLKDIFKSPLELKPLNNDSYGAYNKKHYCKIFRLSPSIKKY